MKHTTDTLSESSIRAHLGKEYRDIPLTVYDECDSTNLRALLYAREHGAANAVFVANSQTAGRGRLGRSFISPEGRGIYLSILTDRLGAASEAVAVTSYAATVVCRAIEELSELRPVIKWVNDIYLGGKKVAGILTQGVVDTESARLTAAVMGVGINVHGTELPEEIADIATTLELSGASIDRSELTARITELFFKDLAKIGSTEIADEYRRRSFLVGTDVNVIKENTTYTAHVTGITDLCELMLLLPDGSREILATGEVSVRQIK